MATTWGSVATVIAAAALCLAGCAQRVTRPAPPAATPAPPPVPLPLVGHFSGVLPCGDCGGIETDLILRADWHGTYHYQLRETHVAADGVRRTFDSQGVWRRRRGTSVDPEAVVYQLDTAGSQPQRLFIVLDEWRIRAVDPNGVVLEPSGAYVLTRTDRRGPPPDSGEPAGAEP